MSMVCSARGCMMEGKRLWDMSSASVKKFFRKNIKKSGGNQNSIMV